jgi:PIN domain nuclease of toxin-antitoxin system
MKYLLDTHVFVWWMLQSKQLDKNISNILEDPLNDVFLSVVTIWEIVIKKKSGKLKVPKDWKETLLESNFSILPIKISHTFETENLPLYHKDPFDRMLIAQAMAEECTLITDDSKIKKYTVPTIG